MILNISYNNKKVKNFINESLGKAYGFIERIKMNGIGSPKLKIKDASIDVKLLLDVNSNAKSCNIEIRPKGILIHFKSISNSRMILECFHFHLRSIPSSRMILESNHRSNSIPNAFQTRE